MFIVFAAVVILTSLAAAQDVPALPQTDLANPATVTVAGTIQSVLGCSDNWQPECDITHLAYDAADDIWRAAFDLPAGEYEYKAALDGAWTVNFGLGAQRDGENIPLVLMEDATVEFFFDVKSGWITDNVNSIIANVPGSYQGEIGCEDTTGNGGDWEPPCLRSWLQDPDGDGVYLFVTDAIPEGSYEAKVAVNESWAENYGAGGARDGANIPFAVPADGTPVYFIWEASSGEMTINVGGAGAVVGNLGFAGAHWVDADTIAWDVDAPEDARFQLHYDAAGNLSLTGSGIEGGQTLVLVRDPEGIGAENADKFPHLADHAAFVLDAADAALVPDLLKGQLALSASTADGELLDATSVQIPGVLDALYTYAGPLGVTWDGDVPTLTVWAPTAVNVGLRLFDTSATDDEGSVLPMLHDPAVGIWSIQGDADWRGKFYVYEVQVFVPSTGQVETNLVTDPYSFSLATNSTRSQIVDLTDSSLMPDGWDALEKPPLGAPEDIVIYELHIRDFSIFDETVPEDFRGRFLAFTAQDSAGMNHLQELAQAGLTHLHLLPAFDIATINENARRRFEPDYAALATFGPDSEEQQAMLDEIRDLDGFNWGYDPYHYTVPEGSYSTDPNGSQRIIEFRQMVQSLNQSGLRVVMDVVYNHTNSAGQGGRSVLDRIVPGYYYRRDATTGSIATSTCCPGTATEHNMMERLMVDSVVTWATAYKVDAFRFDLMGHHMLRNMQAVRSALDALTVEANGVDGRSIYIYGEGWNFGEVADNARGVNATQLNIAGTGLGVFNDRLRDAVRGGNPFGGRSEQGFVSDLYFAPNGTTPGTEEEQLARLLLFGDQIRIGLAGNLRDYTFIGAEGALVTGADILYGSSPAGYTGDPQENIVYISKHDNETIWDILQYKGLDVPVSEMVRMNNLGLNIVLLSQGVPFFQAGDDLLRSKSLDRNSYNSGDWFNRLDFTYQTNNWGVGLPPAGDNADRWEEMRPLLADPARQVTPDDIEAARQNFLEFLQIRRSSPLFRLQTAEQVSAMLTFENVGPDQQPGLIVMILTDSQNIDPVFAQIVVVFNAAPSDAAYTMASAAGGAFDLHPVLAASHDPVVQASAFDSESGTFAVPARTAAVFVLRD